MMRDDDLAGLYRANAQDAPPASLDAAILRAAHTAILRRRLQFSAAALGVLAACAFGAIWISSLGRTPHAAVELAGYSAGQTWEYLLHEDLLTTGTQDPAAYLGAPGSP